MTENEKKLAKKEASVANMYHLLAHTKENTRVLVKT
jgi:hypothetical protein